MAKPLHGWLNATGEKVGVVRQLTVLHPGSNGALRLMGNLELYGALRFLLHHNTALRGTAGLIDIAHMKRHQVAGPQLAVDREIEQRQIPEISDKLSALSDSPARRKGAKIGRLAGF